MRIGVIVRGTVQGVGFRPFVRRAALARGLTGWVKNARDGVYIEIQGDEGAVRSFARALDHELPPPASIVTLEQRLLQDRRAGEETSFRILDSEESVPVAPVLPPDLAACADCLAEVFDDGARRRRYPFTNCARCGPRWSIATGLPYDRRNTSMRTFVMCSECAREYDDIQDRRYHAQPIACPSCGPALSFLDPTGRVVSGGEDALASAIELLRNGGVVGLRGVGGFQILCDATDSRTVAVLRARKVRPHKPFAVMFRDLEQLAQSAALSAEARAVLSSPEAPIVLLDRRPGSNVSEVVAPGSRLVGAMLPYSPLHALLFESGGPPLVCTSGNVSEEPICTSTEQALERLAPLVDGLLTHDRPIMRPLDDSVVRVGPRRSFVVRRARGYVPRSVATIRDGVTVLALGAHLKSTVTLGHRGALVPSQHLGDLDSPRTRELFESTIDDLCTFFDARPSIVACDLHPDYASTLVAERLAERWSVPLLRVQHHHAHVAACIAEHAIGPDEPVFGLAWDGTGLGVDGTIWGGEALVCRGKEMSRFGTLRPFPLLGGDLAAREPRRSALGLVFEVAPGELSICEGAWSEGDLASSLQVLERHLAPTCSSVGRLFDAVAALLGLVQRCTFEGQAAMAVERLAATVAPDGAYPLPLVDDGVVMGDTRALVEAVLADLRVGMTPARIARRFHEALIAFGVALAERARVPRVVLSGGCLQNELLADGLEERLERAGFEVHVPLAVPANDGGISVGQAWLAAQHAEGGG
jgi:hydrogenase maturation protein HypF